MSATESALREREFAATPAGEDRLVEGRWLTVARAGWVALTVVMVGLSLMAIPKTYDLFQAACIPGAHCDGFQLTAYDLHLLRQLHLSPGFLATYNIGSDLVTLLIYCALAALIISRRSQRWMAVYCAYMLVLEGGATYTQLLDYGLRPLARAWYWPVGVLEWLAQVGFVVFFLLFPSGRFVPRWSRWIVLIAAAAEVKYVFFTDYLNTTHSGAGNFLIFAAVVCCIVGFQVYRYRRVSSNEQRRQTKWVVSGFALAIAGLVSAVIAEHMIFPNQVTQSPVVVILIAGTLWDLLLLLIPVSIAVAILRSRLFDIDVIIRRALLYGSLTIILAAVYFGAVFGMQAIVSALTRQTKQQPVVIVASTLLIAALFTPLRRRIQSGIDRRFFRSKYDAARTLATFAVTLRSETDLPHLSQHLVSVVAETMQPESISLWLRQRPAPRAHS